MYPCNYNNANIKKMKKLMEIHDLVGYSDHIQGSDSAKIAISEGAVVIEKHFTLDNDLPGRDNKFAILPHQMLDISDYILKYNMMLEDLGVDFQDGELDSRKTIQEDSMDNLSIIIRNKDEQDYIGFAIQSCLDFFKKPEIIIIDNDSRDDSLEIVNLFSDRTSVRVLNNSTYTPGKSINLGVRNFLKIIF